LDDLHHQRHKTSSSSSYSPSSSSYSSSSSSSGYYGSRSSTAAFSNNNNNNSSSSNDSNNNNKKSAGPQQHSWDIFQSSSTSFGGSSGVDGLNSSSSGSPAGSSKADPSSKWVSYAGSIPKLELHYDPRNALAGHIYEQLKTFQVRPGEHPDLIVPIGGDGYLMKCVRKFWSRFIPFFGVNAGHVGFLLNDAGLLEEFFCAPLRLYQVSMLYCVAENLPPENEYQRKELLMKDHFRQQAAEAAARNNSNIKNSNNQILPPNQQQQQHQLSFCAAREPGIVRSFAFNDAWMERATGQTAKFRICVNGVERSRAVRGDGVLVSTASGSTAYAQALGGSPMPIDTPILQLVGSNCTWPVRWRPVHLPEDVTIELESVDAEKRPCRAYVDSVDLGLVKRLTVRASRVAGVQLAFTRSSDVQAKLYKMQFPDQSQ
jgi:NAD+ kinase